MKIKRIFYLFLFLFFISISFFFIGNFYKTKQTKQTKLYKMELFEYIKSNEGISYFPHPDTEDVWTIGIGRNLEANPLSLDELRFALDQRKEMSLKEKNYWLNHGLEYVFEKGITDKTANYLFAKDVENSQNDLNKIFGQKVLSKLSSSRRIVLTDMIFNLGATRFSSFAKMIQAVKDEKPKLAAIEILKGKDTKFSKYAIQLPERANKNAVLFQRGRN